MILCKFNSFPLFSSWFPFWFPLRKSAVPAPFSVVPEFSWFPRWFPFLVPAYFKSFKGSFSLKARVSEIIVANVIFSTRPCSISPTVLIEMLALTAKSCWVISERSRSCLTLPLKVVSKPLSIGSLIFTSFRLLRPIVRKVYIF